MTTYEYAMVVSPPARGSEARGTLFALFAVPVGIAAWVVIWSLGFIAGIVTFAVAVAATWLYRKGSRGVMTATGAFIVVLMVLLTLTVGLVAGLAVDYVREIAQQNSLTWSQVINYPQFWQFFGQDLPALITANTTNIMVALAFAAGGSIAALSTAFKRDAPAATPVSELPMPSTTSIYGPITPAKDMPQLPEEQWISYRPPTAQQESGDTRVAVITAPVRVAVAPVAPAPVAPPVPPAAEAPVAPAPEPVAIAYAAPVDVEPIEAVQAETVVEKEPEMAYATVSFAPIAVEESPKAPRHRQD